MNMQLIQAREEANDALADFTSAATAIDRAGPQSDLTALQATFSAAEASYTAARSGYERARALVPSSGPRTRVTSEPLTYQRSGPNRFFRDVLNASSGNLAAAQRLDQHRQEMRKVRPDAQFDLSSTDSAGGYLVAPLWLQEEFVNFARAGAAVVNALGPRPLPPNTDSINLPRMSSGTAVATQADNATVQETDAAFDTVAADVKTVAGLQDVSRQVVDRSVPGVDEVIFADLAKAFYAKLDADVINSSTANNLGLMQVSGINSITYTDATPTVPELYPKLADAIRQVHEGVFMPPTAMFMHPRRWAWILASLDTQNRPLVTPYAPVNAAGDQGGVESQGLVGNVQGVPVYTDPNVPSTLGASTNEDRIIVVASPECYVWADPVGPYLERFDDVGSGTLTVRFRLHNYWGQCHARRPKAISVVSGSGLVSPAF